MEEEQVDIEDETDIEIVDEEVEATADAMLHDNDTIMEE